MRCFVYCGDKTCEKSEIRERLVEFYIILTPRTQNGFYS